MGSVLHLVVHVHHGILAPSHVLTAIGVDNDMATSAVRFTLGDENTLEDVENIVSVLKSVVEKLRMNKKREKIKCDCNK